MCGSHLFVLCRYAASVGAKHFQTSAKLNRGLNDLFLDLSRSERAVNLFTYPVERSFSCKARPSVLDWIGLQSVEGSCAVIVC